MAQQYTGQGQPEYGDGHVTLNSLCFSYVTQGKWVYYLSTSYPMYTICYNASNAQNDQLDYFIWLSKGTYRLSVYGDTGASMAISTVYLDGSSIGTLDWYSGSAAYGVLKSISSIAVTTSGRHTLSFKAATRNGSSSGWYLQFHSICMYRES